MSFDREVHAATFAVMVLSFALGFAGISTGASISEVQLRVTDDAGWEFAGSVEVVVRPDPSEIDAEIHRFNTRHFKLPFHEQFGTRYVFSVSGPLFYTTERSVVISETVTKLWFALEAKSIAGVASSSISGRIRDLPSDLYDVWVRAMPLLRINDVREINLSRSNPDFAFHKLSAGRYLLIVIGRKGGVKALPQVWATKDVYVPIAGAEVDADIEIPDEVATTLIGNK